MAGNQPTTLETLLDHPDAKAVIGNMSLEMGQRLGYAPPRCAVFSKGGTELVETERYVFHIDQEARKQLPGIIGNRVQQVLGTESPSAEYGRGRKVGIVFSGGPAPGGHNVIAGLFDAAMAANPENRVYGFLMGPDGIIENDVVEITAKMVDAHRNCGGFSMIKTGRTKIDSTEKMAFSRETCLKLGLDAVVVVGGDDSNTNAAFMAEELLADRIQVIGVPKTIDGDIQVKDAKGNVLCAISFGFHTAARGFAKNISDLCTDSNSDVKYWHICKVMGRVASHLALEVALQTHANITPIGEDLADYVDARRIEKAQERGEVDYSAYGMTLRHLSRLICDAIVRRAAAGKNYGVAVIPEGVLEFINEIQTFIIKLNTIIAEYNETHDEEFHAALPTLAAKQDFLRRLARNASEEGSIPIWNSRDDELFADIPAFFQEGLLVERDSHGNFQFSQVETDKIIMGMVTDYLAILKEKGRYKVGIDSAWYEKTLERAGLDPAVFGPVIFRNYGTPCLLVKESIISVKTLKQALAGEGAIGEGQEVPAAIERVYKKSVPSFKTQTHFYGYDGRGGDPTKFDCDYTYNLGQTVFSLIAGGATGQMAAIKNLEKDFDQWEPMGIPIAPLMHLEERKGKMALVLEKSVVELDSPAFRIVEALREDWLAAGPGPDQYRNPGAISLPAEEEAEKPLILSLNALA